MGIALSDEQLVLVLDDAVARARSNVAVPPTWTERVDRLGQLGIKTYIAALGAAMLAKATDPRVDVLTQDVGAGPHGYSLRKVAELMAKQNHGRYHMGATGRNPMNNRPFLGGPARVDEFTKISAAARPAYEAYRDCLIDLNKLSTGQASDALVAWLRVRMQVQATTTEEHGRSVALVTKLDADALIEAAERFVRENPENGRRGQAFVAAALDCAFDDVVLQPINNPHPGDVQVRRGGKVVWIAEVKQVAVDEQTAFDLALAAQAIGASVALLAVFAPLHQPLERERVRRQALRKYWVMLEIAESVRELLGHIAVFSTASLERIVEQLPGRYAARMREHGVSELGQRRWRELMEARGT